MISSARTIEADDTGSPGSPATPGSPSEDLMRFGCNGLSRLTNAVYPTPDLKLERCLPSLGQDHAMRRGRNGEETGRNGVGEETVSDTVRPRPPHPNS